MRACYVSGKVVDYFKTVQKQTVKMGENKVKSKSAPSLFSRGHNTNDSATVTNVKMFEKLAISKWPSRSFKVIGIGANWSDTCDFLLVLLCNYISIVYHFRDMASYLSKVADFAYPTYIWHPRWGCHVWISDILWHQKREYISLYNIGKKIH